MRTLLIVVDGMRPDAIEHLECVKKIMRKSSYCMRATTVMPPVTLPCHMSLFHSVDSYKHGTVTNVFAPQVRSINGLCEVLYQNNKKSAFFYSWGELRDISKPNTLTYSFFCKAKDAGYEETCDIVTNAAIKYLGQNYVDFTFLYLGYPDAVGHRCGWMSKEYMHAIEKCWDEIELVINSLPDGYSVFITADHGGHEKNHGENIKEDMLIPLIIIGEDFEKNAVIENANIKDIAPTIAAILGVEPDSEWEGKCIKPNLKRPERDF